MKTTRLNTASTNSLIKNTLLFLCMVFATSVHAQNSNSYSFTVQQAIDYALKNQVNVKNSEIDTRIAQARINELIGVGLPQITGSANINKFIDIPTSFVPGEFFGGEPGSYYPVKFGQNYSSSAGISANQLLFDGSYVVGLQASRTYAELSRKNLQQTKIETAIAVSKAYYLVLVSRERLKQLNSDLERVNKLKSDTKALYDNGFVEKIDYDRVELNYNLLENAKASTERFAETTLNLLKYQMGLDQKTPLELTETISDINFDSLVLNGDSANYKNRIEYSILESQYKLSQLDVKKNRFTRLPSLVLFGNWSANASRDEFTIFNPDYRWYPTSVVGVSLTVPIFGGFQKYSQTQQARLTQQKVENAFYMLEQGINTEYTNAQKSLQNNLGNLETQKKNRELAREVARVSKIKYDQGVGSNLEVVDAESSLREAETAYYTALFDAIVAKLDLDKAAGNIKY